ncbi:hypothetical protein ACWD26_12255 [Streptomyces sp. NPDC002787]
MRLAVRGAVGRGGLLTVRAGLRLAVGVRGLRLAVGLLTGGLLTVRLLTGGLLTVRLLTGGLLTVRLLTVRLLRRWRHGHASTLLHKWRARD